MPFPNTKFSTFLVQRKEFSQIDDTRMYKRARVRLHWKGIVLRDEVEGALIKTKDQQIARAGELLVAEIDAKVGGVGLVPPDLDRAIVSNHYFLFEIDESKCLRSWLDWFIRSGGLADQFLARGSTNYAAIRPHHVLKCELPLPSLNVQRRIVAKIEEFAAKTDEVKTLEQELVAEAQALCRAFFSSRSHGAAALTPMRQLVRMREPNVQVDPTTSYHFAGIYCFGRGVFSGKHMNGSEFSYQKLTRLRAGDFVYPKLMAWEGALGIVPQNCDGLVVSPEFPVFELLQDAVLPETLDVYFRSPSVWPELAAVSTGTNMRRRRLHPSAFLDFKIPLPSMKSQKQLRAIKTRVDAIGVLQAQAVAELDALTPSILSKAFHGEL